VSNDQTLDPADATDLLGVDAPHAADVREPAASPSPLRILPGNADLVCVDDACAPLEPAP
jgi:hypothetical protein